MKLVNLNAAIKMDNTPQLVNFLKHEAADFVVLQEMTRHLDDGVRTMYRSHEAVKTALGATHPYNFFAPIWVSNGFRLGNKVEREFGGYVEQGLDIFSKVPVVSGANEFFYKDFEYVVDWSSWHQEDHGRSLQIAQFTMGGKPLRLMNIHGIWTADKHDDDRTVAECQYVLETVRRSAIPTILAGDFNLLPETQSIQLLNRYLRNLVTEFSVPSTRPSFKDEVEKAEGTEIIDYIFVNEGIRVTDLRAVNSDISDHLPLVLEFELK